MGIFQKRKIFFITTLLSYIIWGLEFIYHSSFIGIDGERYFSLFDDAMISMRYGWNFANGNGLVWNPGEYVQGYTNLLMTLLMSIANIFFQKRYAVLSIQILGLFLMVFTALVTVKTVEEFFPKIVDDKLIFFVRNIVLLGVLTYFPLSYWSLLGMETGLLTALLVLSVYFCFKYLREKKNNLWMMTLFLSLAFLTRMDSLIYAVSLFAILVIEAVSSKTLKSEISKIMLSGTFFGLVILSLLLFQKVYYGSWLPNTYFLKITGLPLISRIKNGVIFVKPFIVEHFVFILLPLIGLLLKFQRKRLLLSMLFLSSIIYQIIVGGENWFYWRIMSPTIPLAILLSALALVDIGNRISGVVYPGPKKTPIFQGRYQVEKITILFMVLGIFSANIQFLPELTFKRQMFEVAFNERNVNVALILSEITSSNATIGVLPAGSIPYYTGRTAIDYLGKCDEYIANLQPDLSGLISINGMDSVPGHNKYDLNYSIKLLRPTYSYVLSYGVQDLSYWGEDYYIPLRFFETKFYLLKDSPDVMWEKIETIDGLEIITE